MSTNQKYLFDVSFEQDQGPDGPGEKRKERPKYFEADLEQARQEGFAAGKDAGAKETRGAIEEEVNQTLDKVSQQLTELFQAQAEALERQSREAVETAVTVVRRLFPAWASKHGLSEIESIVGECLERLREEPRIVIRVADQLLDQIQSRIGGLATRCGFDGKIVYLSQEGLSSGDVRVEWANGGAERDSNRLWREIDDVIGRVIGGNKGRQAGQPLPASESKQDPTAEQAPMGQPADGAARPCKAVSP